MRVGGPGASAPRLKPSGCCGLHQEVRSAMRILLPANMLPNCWGHWSCSCSRVSV